MIMLITGDYSVWLKTYYFLTFHLAMLLWAKRDRVELSRVRQETHHWTTVMMVSADKNHQSAGWLSSNCLLFLSVGTFPTSQWRCVSWDRNSSHFSLPPHLSSTSWIADHIWHLSLNSEDDKVINCGLKSLRLYLSLGLHRSKRILLSNCWHTSSPNALNNWQETSKSSNSQSPVLSRVSSHRLTDCQSYISG
jgi:hypothetical protein